MDRLEQSEETDRPQLGEEERKKVLYDWNPKPTDYPETTVQNLFEKQVSKHGDSTALVFGDGHLTYRELNEQANRLAHYLIATGVQPGQGVAIFLDRGISQLVSTLAILKAGAAYIPLDVEFPPERIGQMLEDAKPPVMLTQSKVAGRLTNLAGTMLVRIDGICSALESCAASNPEVDCGVDSLAYIMYTSGSTGRPKGVEVVHRGIVRLLMGTDYIPFGKDTIILHMAAVSFDASTFEIWGSLLHGGMCVVSPSRVPTLESIGHLLANHQVNTIFMTTALFNLAVSTVPEIFGPVKHLLTGGEAQSPWHIEKALRELPSSTRLYNVYGPTENTTFSTSYEFKRDSFDAGLPIPIGRSIANSTCYILDCFLRPVPPGVPGELYVGGDGVARGYIGRPELTSECFLPDPFHERGNARMYKTGDMVCWNRDGFIEFIGRVDNQIKLRGFRIELQEIDLTLAEYPGVEQAVTVAYEDEARGKWLASFVKSSDGDQFEMDGLKAFANEKLPDYMVPAAFVSVGEWFYTPSGKIDRKSLPKPELLPSGNVSCAPPETETQEILGDLWKNLLNLEKIGVDDNFFDIGGDSLCSVHLFHEISRHFGRELPLATLSQHPTIRGLAMVIDRESGDGQFTGFRSLQVLQKGDDGVTPLFLIHGGLGNVLVYKSLVDMLDPRQPVYAFQWPGWDGFRGPASIREMATIYKRELEQLHPEGNLRLGGYCIGGLIAIELANVLLNAGRDIVGPLFVWDSPNLESKHYWKNEPWDSAGSIEVFNQMKTALRKERFDTGADPSNISNFDYSPPTGKAAMIRVIPGVMPFLRYGKSLRDYYRTLPSRIKVEGMLRQRRAVSMELRSQYCVWCMHKAVSRHRSSGYSGDVLYFRSDCLIGRFFDLAGWWEDIFLGFSELCGGKFTAHAVGGGHSEILEIPEMGVIVKRVLNSPEHS